MNTGRISNEMLRHLCIKNQWFTQGTSRQYEKLFHMNNQKATIEQIATVIWLCSDEDTTCRRDIIFELSEAGFTARDDKTEREHLQDWLNL
ncbi:MAG: hypothetical protein PUK18_02780 [Firmicutes bacterium]|nr:hypothetical protein [Bacillota bacterium]MDY6159367.1 hypothetical protein [Candidatus Faecousia sp.]